MFSSATSKFCKENSIHNADPKSWRLVENSGLIYTKTKHNIEQQPTKHRRNLSSSKDRSRTVNVALNIVQSLNRYCVSITSSKANDVHTLRPTLFVPLSWAIHNLYIIVVEHANIQCSAIYENMITSGWSISLSHPFYERQQSDHQAIQYSCTT